MTIIISQDNPRYSTLLLNYEWHSKIIGFLVGVLMVSIYLWLFSGFINLLYNLYLSVLTDWTHGAEKMIKDVVILLAALELIRTFQSYLTLGRVKVTFILDAALVVLIGELISLWYGHYAATEVLVNITVISILTLLRIVTTKYSPNNPEDI